MIKSDEMFTSNDVTKSERYLHTPSAFAKKNLLYVQEVGVLESLKPHLCAREKLDSYLFMVVLEGAGTIKVANKEYSVQKNDCALIDCMEHYEHISSENKPWKIAWVHFNGASAKDYYSLFKQNNEKSNVFSVLNAEEWLIQLKMIMALQNDDNRLDEFKTGEQILSLLNNVIAKVIDDESENEKTKKLAGKAREYVNNHYLENDILVALSAELKKKEADIEAAFSCQYRISLSEYINNRRYNAAKELLRFSVKSVDEIAAETGIGSAENMEKMFMEKEGTSAVEYRKKWAGWIRN